jgi:23S rRNA pseudouridine1911/1915/1917 synthase
MARQALHAARLRLRHPVTAQPLDFESAPPADLQAAMAECGLRYNHARVASAFLDPPIP